MAKFNGLEGTPAPGPLEGYKNLSNGQINFGADAQDSNRLPSTLDSDQRFVDPFWQFTDAKIDASRWNQRYPYQLLVLTVSESGTYSVDSSWMFTLPIPPESLSITTPFAISTQVTVGGIVEEHNGAPIRMLTFSGTTGVLPVRETAASKLGVPDIQRFTGGVLAGTIANVAQSTVVSAQTLLGVSNWNLMDEAGLRSETGAGAGTGYYQFRLLQKFLESYVEMKKRPEGRNKRLAVAIWKDQAVYVVSPMTFDLRRSASDPLAYQYNLSFKSWRRVKLSSEGPNPANDYRIRRNDPTFLQNILNALTEARFVLSDAESALQAVRGDVSKLFENLRQVTALIKDAMGVGLTAFDMPASIVDEFATTTGDFSAAISTAILRIYGDKAAALFQGDTPVSADERSTSSALLAAQSGQGQSASPVRGISKSINENSRVLDAVEVNKLKLKPSTQKKIQEEIERVRQLTASDFDEMRDDLQNLSADFADSIGAGSTTFNTTFGRPDISTSKAATEEDFNILFALNNAILEMSRLAVALGQDNSRLQAIEFVAGLARRSGIAFTTPVSKFAVPFPYGSTLEQLSLRYLGDANRWHEIAALNGLRSPYVDEEGFELPLLTNGYKHQVTLASAENLYVGQPVTIVATNTPRARRRITKIDHIHAGMVIVHLDGDEDLDRFTTMAGAFLHAYLPDTVNSGMQIYIPSTEAVSNDDLTSKAIPGVKDFDGFLEAGGVDLLLTQEGDLAITPDGDCKLAVGLTNLVQRVRIALATPRGSLPQHPSYGLGLRPGMSTADLNAQQLLDATRGLFSDDPSFTGVYAASVQKKGPGVRLSVSVGIAGQDIVLPVAVDVTR